jgi:hypothetical protein
MKEVKFAAGHLAVQYLFFGTTEKVALNSK